MGSSFPHHPAAEAVRWSSTRFLRKYPSVHSRWIGTLGPCGRSGSGRGGVRGGGEEYRLRVSERSWPGGLAPVLLRGFAPSLSGRRSARGRAPLPGRFHLGRSASRPCSTDESVMPFRRCQRSDILSFHGLLSPPRSSFTRRVLARSPRRPSEDGSRGLPGRSSSLFRLGPAISDRLAPKRVDRLLSLSGWGAASPRWASRRSSAEAGGGGGVAKTRSPWGF